MFTIKKIRCAVCSFHQMPCALWIDVTFESKPVAFKGLSVLNQMHRCILVSRWRTHKARVLPFAIKEAEIQGVPRLSQKGGALTARPRGQTAWVIAHVSGCLSLSVDTAGQDTGQRVLCCPQNSTLTPP